MNPFPPGTSSRFGRSRRTRRERSRRQVRLSTPTNNYIIIYLLWWGERVPGEPVPAVTWIYDILYIYTTTRELVPAMTWIYNIILLLGREGVGILPEPVPDATIVGYIYNTTREPTSTMHLERVPSGTRSRRNTFTLEHVPAVPWEPVPAGTRSRRAPVPAVSPERVPGEHAPTGGTKAGGAGGTVVRTYGYLSFSRRCVRRASLGRNV